MPDENLVRAEIAAYRAESAAQFERIKAHMERQDRDSQILDWRLATIIEQLMRLIEGQGNGGER